MAVHHTRALMYDFLCDEMGADHEVMNADGHTPLTLAATLNNIFMFDHLLRKHRSTVWKYGKSPPANIPTGCLRAAATSPFLRFRTLLSFLT